MVPAGLYLETLVSIETFCEKWSLFGLYFEEKSLNLKIGNKSWKSDQKMTKIQPKPNQMKVDIYKLIKLKVFLPFFSRIVSKL